MTYRAGTGYLQAYNRTGSSWLPMQINGSTVTVTNMSDERVKSNIEDLRTEYGLSGILKLRPVNYTWRDADRDRSHGLQVGLVAQDVQRVYPKLVTQFGTDDTITYADGSTETVHNVLGLNYNGLIIPLVKSVQDIKAEKDAAIAQLKAESATLMARADQADARAEKAAAESSQLKTFLCSQFPAAPMCHQ
ncbi:MAG: tail fiber domain-containing protein [Proteobacteria bacterium]|nr:tail fiber domain-containing protein [Pseudomonadota bacterium]